MGQFPASAFESFRVRFNGAAVPTWKVRLVMFAAAVIGLVVFLLLLPLILFVALLFAAWVLLVRARIWLSGLGRRGGSPDTDGRENVRVLVRDA